MITNNRKRIICVLLALLIICAFAVNCTAAGANAEKDGGAGFVEVTLALLEGFLKTLELFGWTLLIAIPLGLIFSLISMSKLKVFKYIMRVFIWIIRGTPLMLQLIIIYYGPGLIVKWAQRNAISNCVIDFLDKLNGMGPMVFAVIAFVINYACYFSEIFRGGIESIPVGQREAGQVLGMTKTQIFFRITLIQVVKRIVPPMSNEIITLVKDTSLARIITVYEIIWMGQKFIKLDGIIWPLFYTGAFYLIFSGILTLLFRYIEKKLDYIKC